MAYNNNYNNKNIKKEKVFEFHENTTVVDLASAFGVSIPTLIVKYMKDIALTINRVLSLDEVRYICENEGYTVKLPEIEDPLERLLAVSDDPSLLVSRPPVVTIMGHVDHGKTTLLDTIRKTRVVDKEFGGITQHTSAYQVIRNNKKITFIDTPGHAAFTEMRSRGAKITDIVVLVVSAVDGVMPQTIEVINHVKAAKVKMIVAINKIDVVGANPSKVINELANRGLSLEPYGGDIPVVEVSALKNIGIDQLLDVILLVAELEDYKAAVKRSAQATVIEATLDKATGATATILINRGTLKRGNFFVCGNSYGKVRTIQNELLKNIEEALPSDPVIVTGFSEVPLAGDRLAVFPSEKEAREASEKKKLASSIQKSVSKVTNINDLLTNIKDTELKVIIKTDVQGTAETIKNMLSTMKVGDLSVNVLASNVGAINENDILLAQTSGSIIIGYNLRPNATIKKSAEDKKVAIKLYNIVYRITEDIEALLKGQIKKEVEEHVIGMLEVRQVFKISHVGTVAGCYVTDGYITRTSLCRILRDQVIIYEGKIASLQRFKDEVKEVKEGFECGVSIVNFNDIKVGDNIEVSLMQEVE